MPEIKSRDVVQGTIKTVDRGLIAGQRMKDASVQTRNAAEESTSSSDGNSSEYAQNQIRKGAEHLGNLASHQLKSIASKETGNLTKHPEYTVKAHSSPIRNLVGLILWEQTNQVERRKPLTDSQTVHHIKGGN